MIDYSVLKFGKGTPRAVAKMEKDRAAEAKEQKCRDKVNASDGHRCFFPGCRTRSSDKHHVRPRSLLGAWVSSNILSACRRHHDWFKAGLIRVEGNPDRRPVRVGLTGLGAQAGLRVPARSAADSPVHRQEDRMKSFRQGDVFVQQVRKREPKGQPILDQGRVILAYGEVTGHAHEIIAADTAIDLGVDVAVPPAQLFEEPDGTRYLFVERACTLVHQEHGAIALAPGCYKVVRQREYTPEEIRTVAD
jgi:hypothetical protein